MSDRPTRHVHVSLRPYRRGDGPATHRVFYDAVHRGAAAHYSPYEREAWAPVDTPPDGWDDKLLAQNCQVAEMERRIVGFMSLTETGHIDMAFVAPQVMGAGVADQLYGRLEADARASGLAELTTDASHLARRFFARHGWEVVAAQTIKANGRDIENFRMHKTL
ncbi:GNAT family acetyltransferase [Litoreibacter ponti]|uniref:GNAT family acetyltransferase n=1 Tax=Litoreibacter ponti TaxID=1510457 RepID=A0A2T6BKK5_9RHOB|nr:GNAT family N-acetyltransferase [Litoreibacter ponti]PTX56610.1 GNAT family acetyltransferase [Litoreibacter ponti]